MQVKDDSRGAYRLADLSSASAAFLTFECRRGNLDSASDYVLVQLSSGGASGPWIEVGRIEGRGSDASYIRISFDITNHISTQTAVWFFSSPDLGNGEPIYFDNVEIIHLAGTSTAAPNPLGVSDVEAIAYWAGTGILYAADAEDFGSGDGALGTIDFDDVDGLTFDPFTGILYGARRESGNDPYPSGSNVTYTYQDTDPALNESTTYYWRVRARDSFDTWGDWSPVWSFDANSPTAVTLASFTAEWDKVGSTSTPIPMSH